MTPKWHWDTGFMESDTKTSEELISYELSCIGLVPEHLPCTMSLVHDLPRLGLLSLVTHHRSIAILEMVQLRYLAMKIWHLNDLGDVSGGHSVLGSTFEKPEKNKTKKCFQDRKILQNHFVIFAPISGCWSFSKWFTLQLDYRSDKVTVIKNKPSQIHCAASAIRSRF